MKVVINACYGGFGLSPLAVERWAQLKGRECYFFVSDLPGFTLRRVSRDEAEAAFCFHAYDIPNPESSPPNWAEMPLEERQAFNAESAKHALSDSGIERHDADLVRVVEELGEKANGQCARLKVVEIPDGVEYVIEDYDGQEHIAEAHRTWG